MPAGRPSKYSEELANDICSQLSIGRSLNSVCKQSDMPTLKTVFSWMGKHEEFLNKYTRAKEESAEADNEKLSEIAEKVLTGEYDAQSARVAADIIKWAASKKKPKKYGDRLQQDVTVKTDDLDDLAKVKAYLAENGINPEEIE